MWRLSENVYDTRFDVTAPIFSLKQNFALGEEDVAVWTQYLRPDKEVH